MKAGLYVTLNETCLWCIDTHAHQWNHPGDVVLFIGRQAPASKGSAFELAIVNGVLVELSTERFFKRFECICR